MKIKPLHMLTIRIEYITGKIGNTLIEDKIVNHLQGLKILDIGQAVD